MRKSERDGHLGLVRLAVLLPLALILGSASPRTSPAALAINPSTYDWGPINVGARSNDMLFYVMLPARGSPADAVAVSWRDRMRVSSWSMQTRRAQRATGPSEYQTA